MTLQNQHSSLPRSRMHALEENDITTYAFTFDRSCNLIDVQQDFSHVLPESHSEVIDLRLCGRVTDIRLVDGDVLCYIEDQHAQLQLGLEAAEVGSEGVADFYANICTGDYVGFSVYRIGRTGEGELTAYIYHWEMLAPNQQPTIAIESGNPLAVGLATRRRLMMRSKMVRSLRHSLEHWYDFLEVPLPMQHPEPEEALAQLVSSGFEAVYQLTSTPDGDAPSERLYATMALTDENDMMGLTERLFRHLSLEIRDRRVLPWAPQSRLQLDATSETTQAIPDTQALSILIDMETTWEQRSFYELLAEVTGVDFKNLASTEQARQIAQGMDVQEIAHEPNFQVGDIALSLFHRLVVPTLVQPTFVINFPIEACRCDKRTPYDSRLIGCARLFINGLEFASADTLVTAQQPGQKARADVSEFERSTDWQSSAPSKHLYNLPPTARLVLNIDRLTMLLTGALDIREVQFFPHTKR